MTETEYAPVENFIMRWGSAALLAAGILLVIFCYLHPHSAEQHVDEAHFWALILTFFVPTLLFTMLGFTSLMLRHQQAMGMIGMVGYVALVATLSALFLLVVVQAITHWGEESHGLELLHHLGLISESGAPGPILWTLGVMLVLGQLGFSASIGRSERLYRLPFVVLVLGSFSLFISLSAILPALATEIGAAIYGGGLAWLGWRMHRVRRLAEAAGPPLRDKKRKIDHGETIERQGTNAPARRPGGDRHRRGARPRA